MACAHDSSDSDQNIGPPNKLGSSGKRFISSSEDENGIDNNFLQQNNQAQSSANRNGVQSERRQSLRKKRKFQLPSREKQWDSIPSDCKVTNKLSHLTPRKLINDFTRVTHRYNYDYVEVSGEESMEEFIKSTDSSSSTDASTSDQHRTHKKRHRVKGYRPRIAKLSDDSSEEDELNSSTFKVREERVLRSDSTHDVDTPPQGNTHTGKCQNTKKTFMQSKEQTSQNAQHSEEDDCALNDDDIQPGSSSKNRRKSVFNSDSDGSSQQSSGEDSLKTCKKSKRTNTLNSDSDNDVQLNNEDSNDVQSLSKPSTPKSALVSDSENKDTVEKQTCLKTTDQSASTSKEADNSTNKNEDENFSNNKECDKRSARKDSRDSVIEIDECSSEGESDGSNTDDSDGSSVTDSDSDSAITDGDSDEQSSDVEENVGRIQKLAERKRQRRNSMFDQLKTLRAKRQNKS